MPTAARRRAGVVALLGLLAGALLLMPAPGNPGALRLAGISLLWWYAALVAPLAAVPVATGLSIGLILWANLSLLGDVAGALGYPRRTSSLLAAALALVAVRLRADFVAGGKGLVLLYAGVLGFVVPVAFVAPTVAVAPWNAWRDVASRPALTFGERHAWVTEGRTLVMP